MPCRRKRKRDCYALPQKTPPTTRAGVRKSVSRRMRLHRHADGARMQAGFGGRLAVRAVGGRGAAARHARARVRTQARTVCPPCLPRERTRGGPGIQGKANLRECTSEETTPTSPLRPRPGLRHCLSSACAACATRIASLLLRRAEGAEPGNSARSPWACALDPASASAGAT